MRIPVLRVAIQFENDISLARQRLSHLTRLAGLSVADRTRLVTALSEIARNAFQYAGEGLVEVFVTTREDGQYLETVVKDKGPGIQALGEVLEGRYESRTGMGLGISGAKRLVDRFDVQSTPDKGTQVTLGKRLPPGRPVTVQAVGKWTEALLKEAPKDVYELLQTHNQELVAMMEELRQKERELDSQLRRAEQLNRDLQASNQNLEREVHHRRRVEAELVDAKDAAEAAARAKAQFLANMSHEIRTPMNAVIGIARLLAAEPLGAAQRDLVEMIRGSGDALLAVINDILDFSKIEAGKLELEEAPLDIRGCVESAVLLLGPRASAKGIELVHDVDESVPSFVLGDVTRLRQILLNLLGNAVKFTPEGEVELSVGARACERPGHIEVCFSIRDSGIGIAPDRLEAVFEAFQQADSSTTRSFEGTGLGLTISRRLTEMMGGRIWAASSGVPGEGTTFSFTIRVPQAPPEIVSGLPCEERGPLEALVGRAILVVEDSQAARRTTLRRLEAWGAVPWAAGSAKEALEQLESRRPDLVLLDWHLTDLAGDVLAGRLRVDPRFADIPLVLLKPFDTGKDAPSEQHVTAALTKPSSSRALRRVLGQALSGGAQCPEELSGGSGFDPDLGRRHPLRILLAEDNRINQRVALLTLERLGYTAKVARNGQEVLDAVAREPFDAVLMDVHMPVMDGLEATRRLMASAPAGRRPRIIAMTASVLEEERDRCFEAGMEDWVPKPVGVEELMAALGRTARRTDALSPVGAEKDAAPQSGAVQDAAPTAAPLAASAGERTAPAAPIADPESEAIEDDAFEPGRLRAYEESLGGGDPGRELVLELIRMFREDSPAGLAEIREAIEAGDPEALRTAAHAMKGSAANLGAQGVCALCFALERLGQGGLTTGATALLGRVEAAYALLLGRLQAEVDRRV